MQDPRVGGTKHATLMEAITNGKPVYFYDQSPRNPPSSHVQVIDACLLKKGICSCRSFEWFFDSHLFRWQILEEPAPSKSDGPDLALVGYFLVGISGSLLVFAKIALKSLQAK